MIWRKGKKIKELTSALETANGQLESRAAELQKVCAELKQTRAQLAEFKHDIDNIRARTDDKTQKAREDATAKFAKDLLDLADNFERAAAAFPADCDDEQLNTALEGIRLMQKSLQDVFARHGITAIDTADQTFDPHFHEALFEVATPERKPGTIVQTVQTGYMIGGRLLRPARVGISK